MYRKKQIKNKFYKKHRSLVLGVTTLIVIGGGGLLWYHAHHHTAASIPPVTAATAANTASGPVTKQTTPTPNPNVPGGLTGSNLPSQVVLDSPSGEFVSNHNPSLTAGDPRSQEQSVCNTTVGATCNITFSNGGQTISLGAQTVVASKDTGTGATSWLWTPSGIGLTAGSWKITATAQLSGQSKSTSDQSPLTVSP